MRKVIFASLIIVTLLSLFGCQRLWYVFLDTVVDVAPERFTFEEDQKKLSIPIYFSHPLTASNNEIDHLIVIIHGAGLNAGNAFDTGLQIIESLKIDTNRVMILAPQFIAGVDLHEKGLLFWGRRWRSGGNSLSTGLNKGLPELSSFEVLDKLIGLVTKQNSRIQRIAILGHSAGAQFVTRYAATNDQHEQLEKQRVLIHYVAANSSCFIYLDQARYQFTSDNEIITTSQEKLTDCPDYNQYKYGLEGLYGYAKSLPPPVIQSRVMTRPVIFMLGTKDMDRGWVLDKSCEADVQGKNRYERGLLYRHHLSTFAENYPKSQHVWLEIPGVGHDAAEMFTHSILIDKLKALDF